MCGIVGLYAKTDKTREQLGTHVAAMLEEMGERGPDSAGVAFYDDSSFDAGNNQVASKVTVQSDNPDELTAVENAVNEAFNVFTKKRGTHLVIESAERPIDMEQWVRSRFPSLRIMSAGTRIEIYKEKGHPTEFVENYLSLIHI